MWLVPSSYFEYGWRISQGHIFCFLPTVLPCAFSNVLRWKGLAVSSLFEVYTHEPIAFQVQLLIFRHQERTPQTDDGRLYAKQFSMGCQALHVECLRSTLRKDPLKTRAYSAESPYALRRIPLSR